MKKLNLKIKLLIIIASALILLLVAVSIGQLISLNKKQKQIDNLNQQLDNLVKQIAGTNPPSTSTIQLEKDGISAEISLW